MSIKVMTAVFDRYPNGGGEMLLALALADHASDDGGRVYPSIKHLATKTRQGERSVQYQLRRMEDAGWLILVNSGNGGRNQHREYQISTDWLKGAEIAPFQKGATDDTKGAIHNMKGCNPQHERVQPVAPAYNHHRTIIEPSVNRGSADAATKPTISRACVLPVDFEPNATSKAMAAELGVDHVTELAAFADHHTARGSTFKDWQAAFRTWLRNSVKFGRRPAAAMTAAPRRTPPADNFNESSYGQGGKL